MKITKMPGLGSYGAVVENFDWADPESYNELKRINLKNLVTVVKGRGYNNFGNVAKHFGNVVTTRLPGAKWALKYGKDWYNQLSGSEIDIIKTTKHWPVDVVTAPGWVRVTGEKTQDGIPLGLFGETELLWHSDESAIPTFAPVVALYGMRHMNTSATCFVQTADWYESQTESFRSELDDLVAIYNWDNNKIQPGSDYINEEIIKSNNVPVENYKLPLVINSTGGIKGLYFSNFITKFEGMSQQESDNLLDKIRSEIFVPDYRFDYWWEHGQGDLVIFEQSITLHKRLIKPGLDLKTELAQRLAYRSTGDYTGLLDYNPFTKEPYQSLRKQSLSTLNDPTIIKTLTPDWQAYIERRQELY